jgi:hypothetical protein
MMILLRRRFSSAEGGLFASSILPSPSTDTITTEAGEGLITEDGETYIEKE